ncbi:MAG: CvpA family protein [Firmicutes bacterium]|nr:CvpA family protein [Bacillota bacterium]
MNIFDIGIVLILIMCAITGFKKGVIKETVSLIGIILVFVIAFLLKGYVGNILCKYLPFFQFSGNLKGIVALNILMYQIIAFFILYSILIGIYAIVLRISGIFQKLVNMTIVLIIPSKIGGAIVSFISGYIIMFVVLLTLSIPLKNSEIFTSSNMVNKILYNTPVLSNSTSGITDSTKEICDLGKMLSKKEINTNEANLKTLDVMLKHKIVNKKTVEQLIVLDKLNGINNINSVLNKYN